MTSLIVFFLWHVVILCFQHSSVYGRNYIKLDTTAWQFSSYNVATNNKRRRRPGIVTTTTATKTIVPSRIFHQSIPQKRIPPTSTGMCNNELQCNVHSYRRRRRTTAIYGGRDIDDDVIMSVQEHDLKEDHTQYSRSKERISPIETLELQPPSRKKNNSGYNNRETGSTNEVKQEQQEAHFCVVDWEDVTHPYLTSTESESTWVEYTDDGLVIPSTGYESTKEVVANFLEQPIIEVVLLTSVLISCFLAALSTLPILQYESNPIWFSLIREAQNLVGIVLLLEFLGRWYSSSAEVGRYVLSPKFASNIIVVVIPTIIGLTPSVLFSQTWGLLPDWLTGTTGLISLQLLRLLRLQRILKNLPTFQRFERALGLSEGAIAQQEWQLQLARVGVSLFTLLTVATGMIYIAEKDVNPLMTDYFTALYFGMTTLCTVGFGDITPVTPAGKLVVSCSIIAGVVVVPSQAAKVVEALLQRQEERNDKDDNSVWLSQNRSKSINSSKQSQSLHEENMVLDTAFSCSECGASLHWSNARYCYSCGSEL